jgi:hypothetical protein
MVLLKSEARSNAGGNGASSVKGEVNPLDDRLHRQDMSLDNSFDPKRQFAPAVALTSTARRSSSRAWGPRSPHEAQAEASRSALQEKGTPMHAPNTISVDKLDRLIGTPKCPTLIDVPGQRMRST